MEIVKAEVNFLQQFEKAKAGERKKLIKTATKEQLTAIANCIYNIDITIKCIKKFAKQIKKFIKTKFTVHKLRNFLYKNQHFVSQIIGAVLATVLQQSILTVCGNG